MSAVPTPREDLERIIESAKRLGVQIDEEEALQWLTAMAASHADEVQVDAKHGVYGQRISLLDFSPQDLAYFREIGKIVEIPDRAGVVETALALSGSAAQSKIQTHPGDCDFFERVNIKAPTREEACKILADVIHDKVMSTKSGPTYRLMEVKFGSYPLAGKREGKSFKKGAPISWTVDDVEKGSVWVEDEAGKPVVLDWKEVANDSGWTKIDWVVAHPPRRSLANASNNLDVTWESPDGEIVPLDGQLDPYFQEIYLEADSIPLFTKIAKHVAADAVDGYVAQLEQEVKKYTTEHINYGKAAKRMYNVFRMNGRYMEAAYLRELFNEPATVLYQIASLLRTVDEASLPGSDISPETIAEQLDTLIIEVVDVLEGEREKEIVKRLLRLRSLLTDKTAVKQREDEVTTAQDEVMEVVNNFFYERLIVVPSIKEYLDSLRASA
ncbi:MAG: hypothetical protein HY258_11795 [Chloroflexi bacterium]|nr:hypothetical protein [Chloroflexota bacterium]